MEIKDRLSNDKYLKRINWRINECINLNITINSSYENYLILKSKKFQYFRKRYYSIDKLHEWLKKTIDTSNF